jgi:ATP-binding cassette subfamily C protein CydD
LTKALKLAQVDDLSLDLQVGQGGSQISGGQAQRVSLARCFYRALTTDVSYLLLDEPISAIDETRARSVVASLLELSSNGRTVIAITHQGLLSEAASNILELSFD